MGKKKSKQDEYLEDIQTRKWFMYLKDIDGEKVIGVSADYELAAQAQKSIALRKLKNAFKYKVQMVIP